MLGVISTCSISFLSISVDISILLCNFFPPFSLWIASISFVFFHSKHTPCPCSASLKSCPCVSLFVTCPAWRWAVPASTRTLLQRPFWCCEQNWRCWAARQGWFWCSSWDFRWQRSRFFTFCFIVGLLYSGAAISSGALAAWEQKCAQHTLWMCQSLTESKHWYNPPSVTRLFSPC